MSESARILIVEDLLTDAELAQREVRKTVKSCTFRTVETREDYLAALEEFQPDLIISDYRLPRFDGLTALKLALERAALIPVIILTSALNEDTAVECMKAGAADYVIKEHIKRLGQAVVHALEQKQLRQERRRAEAALRQSEERYRSLYLNANVGIYRTTPEGRILLANPAAVRILGYESFDELAQGGLEQMEQRSPIEIRERLERDGTITGFESTWIRKDGVPILLSYSAKAIRDETGKIVSYDGTFEDITERKRAQEELRQEQLFTEAILDSLPGLFLLIDSEGRLVRWNKEAERVSGYTAEEIARIDPIEFFVEEDRPVFGRTFAEVFTKGKAEGEARLATKQGEVVPYYFAAWRRVLRDRDYLVGFGLDITQRTRLEQQLRQAQKMEAIGTLAGGIAHDFNNMLQGIIGYSELAVSALPADHVTQDYLNQVLKASRRASDLVAQILTFSRQRERQRITLSLQPVIKEALKFLRASLPSTITVYEYIDASCGPVRADPTQIHQVVINLCTNAFHAMREKGGTLEVVLEQYDSSTGVLSGFSDVPPGPYACLTVSDTGHGIDPEKLQRIFDPFFTTKAPGEGTGMGLATVHGIVKDHGGFIRAQSQPGSGTVFRVLFPLSPTKPETATGTRFPREQALGSERVLFVDDERSVMESSVLMLKRLGYKVTCCLSSIEAWTLFKEKPADFDIVVTDQTMPNMTGLELAERLRTIRPDTPIILYSGYTDAFLGSEVKAQKIDEFLVKPVLGSDIAGAIRRVRAADRQG